MRNEPPSVAVAPWVWLSCAILLGVLMAVGQTVAPHGEYSLSGGQDTRREPPNILVILTDDQRWDTMGCYGNAVIRTPNFDRLAAEGARLDKFYVAAPLCCPSRAALLSGLYPHQSGVDNNLNKPDLPTGTLTVADYLNRAGYVTGFVGKAHLGGDPRRWHFRETPIWLPLGASRHRDPLLMVHGKEQQVPGQITQIFTDAALQFLERHQRDKWFLWFATTAPHTPYQQWPRFTYSPDDIQAPPGWPAAEPFNMGAPWPDYYSTIGMLDDQVGRLLRKLDELGLTENTIVFLMSDNGYMFGSHGQPRKQVWYDESARMPALVRWPVHIAPGAKIDTPLDSVDVLPTLLDAAGVKVEPTVAREGVNMLPALIDGKAVRTAVYSEVDRSNEFGGGYWQMVRDERWKYVRFRSGEEHLYDMVADKDEEHDLAADAGSETALRAMRTKLDQWLQATPPLATVNRSARVSARNGERLARRVCCPP